MNHRTITISLSALLAGASFVAGQEPLNGESAPDPQNPGVPVLKEIPVIGRLFTAADVEKQNDFVTKVKDGVITLKAGGDAKGKATITIDVNGKKETREIDLGNATEIKITTDSEAAKPSRVTYLGVAPEELSEELASQLPIDPGSGLLIRTVLPDSPAATAGLQKNDVLLKLDDQILSAPKQLQKLVASRKPGETVRVVYFRKGQRAEVEAKLAEHEELANAKFDVLLDSIRDSERNPKLDLYLGGHGSKHGSADTVPLRVPIDPLTFQKKIVIVDKDGNVVTKDDSEGQHEEAIKRMAAEIEKMRDQAAAAQKQAQEAIRHAEMAAREAAEIAKKEASAVADRMRETIKDLQEQVEKQQLKKKEQREQ